MKVRSKICGIRCVDDMKWIAALQPDYMGFIFYPASLRYMEETLGPADLDSIPQSITKTGVFVNGGIGPILRYVSEYGLGAVQLHGDETPAQLATLQQSLPGNVEVIKAFGISPAFDWKSLNDYQDCCDVFLFDTKTANYGGSGRKFDHDLLKQYTLRKPVMMSGGIGLDDLHELLGAMDFDLWGIDMNSKLETSPGRKDPVKVKRALEIIKEYEQH